MAMDFSHESKIDNLVCDGGNGLVINGELLGIEPLDKNICLEIIDECIEKKFPFGVSLGDVPELYTCNEWLSNFKMHTKIIVDPQIDFHRVDNIYKIFIMATHKQEAELTAIHKLGYMRYHGDQLIVEPLEKYRGILKMIEIQGGKPEDIVVFGDGHNDIDMLQFVGTGICMENGCAETKAVCDYITDNVDNDGIVSALRYFGLL